MRMKKIVKTLVGITLFAFSLTACNGLLPSGFDNDNGNNNNGDNGNNGNNNGNNNNGEERNITQSELLSVLNLITNYEKSNFVSLDVVMSMKAYSDGAISSNTTMTGDAVYYNENVIKYHQYSTSVNPSGNNVDDMTVWYMANSNFSKVAMIYQHSSGSETTNVSDISSYDDFVSSMLPSGMIKLSLNVFGSSSGQDNPYAPIQSIEYIKVKGNEYSIKCNFTYPDGVMTAALEEKFTIDPNYGITSLTIRSTSKSSNGGVQSSSEAEYKFSNMRYGSRSYASSETVNRLKALLDNNQTPPTPPSPVDDEKVLELKAYLDRALVVEQEELFFESVHGHATMTNSDGTTEESSMHQDVTVYNNYIYYAPQTISGSSESEGYNQTYNYWIRLEPGFTKYRYFNEENTSSVTEYTCDDYVSFGSGTVTLPAALITMFLFRAYNASFESIEKAGNVISVLANGASNAEVGEVSQDIRMEAEITLNSNGGISHLSFSFKFSMPSYETNNNYSYYIEYEFNNIQYGASRREDATRDIIGTFDSYSGGSNQEEGPTFTIWSDNHQEAELISDLIDEYKKNSGANFNVNIEAVGAGSVPTMMLQDIESAADIVCFATDVSERLFASNLLSPVPIRYQDDVIEENMSLFTDCVRDTKGNLYAYPYSSSSTYFMYYDKNVVPEEDLGSLEQILADCEDVHRTFNMELGSAWYNYSFFLAAGCYSHWHAVWDDSVGRYFDSYEDNYNSENGLIAMRAMQNTIKSSAYYNMSQSSDNMAVLITGTWENDRVIDILGSENVGYAPLPSYTVDGQSYHLGAFSSGKCYAVNRMVEKRYSDDEISLIHDIARYITNYDAQQTRFVNNNEMPTNVALRSSNDVMSNPMAKAIMEQEKYNEIQYSYPDTWWNAAGSDLFRAVTSANSIEDLRNALAAYGTEIEAFIEEH